MYLHDDILQESVTYQRMIKTGEVEIINRLLKKRFGGISETIKPRLNTLSVEQLELFGESLFDFECFEDAIAWLNKIN